MGVVGRARSYKPAVTPSAALYPSAGRPRGAAVKTAALAPGGRDRTYREGQLFGPAEKGTVLKYPVALGHGEWELGWLDFD